MCIRDRVGNVSHIHTCIFRMNPYVRQTNGNTVLHFNNIRSNTNNTILESFQYFLYIWFYRLMDPTYTLSEIQELLQNLQDLVHAEIETELISIAHTNVLLLTQIFTQAEKWHLRLTVNLSEIQNRYSFHCVCVCCLLYTSACINTVISIKLLELSYYLFLNFIRLSCF